jgi:hypothetical protein
LQAKRVNKKKRKEAKKRQMKRKRSEKKRKKPNEAKKRGNKKFENDAKIYFTCSASFRYETKRCPSGKALISLVYCLPV